MTSRATVAFVLALGTACSPGVEHRARPSTTAGAPVLMRPGSCHDAAFEPIAGSQVKSLTARTGAPAVLGVRMLPTTPATATFDYVRFDVLPAGRRADVASGEGMLLTGDEERVRRFVADAGQLAGRTVSFLFDGRDEAGTPLAAGSYEVGFVVRTRSTEAGCDDEPATKWGAFTTVVWQPA